jgi:UDP-N-acetylglucosamine 2-epimerase (non-hydrolysing)
MNTKTIMVCFGTRPEVIKTAPVIQALEAAPGVTPLAVTTAQHREMLDQTLAAFGLRPDVDLELMRPGQDLAQLTSAAVLALSETIRDHRPDAIVVQGDTTTAFCAALAGFYAGVPVAHVEAGLRTGRRVDPFPEEANRRLVAPLAEWHFCPTPLAARNLESEGLDPQLIEVTGNTVIDALLTTAARPLTAADGVLPPKRAARRILVTLHRRESQGAAQRALARMLGRVAQREDVEILFPLHLSPAVRREIVPVLGDHDGVQLVDPLGYRAFVHALRSSDLVVTDSGGIQEEAPTFGVPALVMRETTERPEGVEAGCVRLSGTDPAGVERDIRELLDDELAYGRMAKARNPYGDGRAAERIVARMRGDLGVSGMEAAA